VGNTGRETGVTVVSGRRTAFPRRTGIAGVARVRAEVGAAEVGDLGRLPTVETVAAGEGFEHPGVHGEGLELAGAEEQHAVGNFFADAGQFHQPPLGGGVGQGFGFIEPAGPGAEEFRGFGDVAGAEAEQAGAEVFFGDGGEFGPGGELLEM
jgi:hypothetical protein